MTKKILDAAESQSRVLQMLGKSPFVSFATFDADGYPDVRVLLVITTDGVDTIWFACETGSKKIAQLQKNPKATLYAYNVEAMTEFRLFGSVEILSDAAARQKIWRDDLLQYFPEGKDSQTMTVLRFNTDHGIYDDYVNASGKF